MLAYLALSPGRTAAREHLVDLLWSDLERPAGRASLRTALSYLRSRLGEPILIADDRACSVSAIQIDVEDFHAALNRRDYRGALSLYQGDFLDQFASPGCQEFELWADLERARLRSLALRAAEAWCHGALDSMAINEAKRAAQRAREIDPHSQVGWRLELEVAMAGGDLPAASATATVFEKWLSTGGREPEPASTMAIRRARSTRLLSNPAYEQSSPSGTDFVGREAEFSAILDEWKRARAGGLRFVVVSGDAGLGKSRLLDATSNRLRARDQRVLLVRAYHGERDVAGALLATLAFELAQLPGALGVDRTVIPFLIDLDPRLAETFASKPSTAAEATELQLTTAMRELFGAVCDEGPLMLGLDDTQWIDDRSRRILSATIARLDQCALLVITATRSAQCELVSTDNPRMITLGPLARANIEALMAGVAELPHGPEADAVLDHMAVVSRGIPLLILETMQQLAAGGIAQAREGRWEFAAGRLTRDLAYVNPLYARLRALSDEARAILTAAALAGIPLARSAFSLNAESGKTDEARIYELERTGYLRVVDDDRVALHDAVAEALQSMTTPAERLRIARRIGSALAGSRQGFDRGLRLLVDVEDLSAAADAVVRQFDAPDAPRISRVQLARRLNRDSRDPAVVGIWQLLPLRLRYPNYRWIGAGVLTLIVTIAATLILQTKFDSRPFLEVIARTESGGTVLATVHPDARGWIAGTPLAAIFAPADAPAQSGWFEGLVRPGDGSIAGEAVYADSTGVDIVLRSPSGSTRRLTAGRWDETPADWAPDGSQLAIHTNEFSRSGNKTLAILDLRSGAIRPLGPTDAQYEGGHAWSPDGTRMAFAAIRNGERNLCIVAVDGSGLTCRVTRDSIVRLHAWHDPRSLLVSAGARLSVYDFDHASATQVPLRAEGVRNVVSSPDRQWIAFNVGLERTRLFVAPSNEPHRAREVVPSTSLRFENARWGGTTVGDYLDSLLADKVSKVFVGTPHRLQISGRTNRGNAIQPQAIRWRTLSPGIVSVDSNGVVTAIAPGTARISVTAGGWRTTSITFQVVQPETRLLLDEEWDRPFDARWMPFGHPLPRISRDSTLGRVFINNGDGNFFSGAYLRQAFDRQKGITVEANLRTPITRRTHQYLQIVLVSVSDLARLPVYWDHRTGYISRVPLGGQCAFAYPPNESPQGRLTIDPFGPLQTIRSAVGIPEGQTYRVTVGLLPDGRCLLALNNEPPVIGPPSGTLLDSVTVLIQGNSVEGEIAVGRLVIRTGVPPGISRSRVRYR